MLTNVMDSLFCCFILFHFHSLKQGGDQTSNSQKFAHLYLWSAKIKGIHHHTWLLWPSYLHSHEQTDTFYCICAWGKMIKSFTIFSLFCFVLWAIWMRDLADMNTPFSSSFMSITPYKILLCNPCCSQILNLLSPKIWDYRYELPCLV